MDATLERLARLSEKQSKLLAAGLQQRLERRRHRQHEPLAVLGMSCRFPGGANDVEGYWQRLRDGVDCISEMHDQRWPMDELYDPDPNRDGTLYTRGAGLLDDVEHFDAEFFGISPREASVMDPQQRLLLETSWEALEQSGYAASALGERRVGVFVGIATSDYSHLENDPAAISAYHGSGNSFSVAAGRLSYFFGFEGPSLSVDTACSSSLVTAHLACQSLRRGECRMALVGGVNLMLFPAISLTFCRARMLAPDGRCKTFDARADGYVRGEGCGVMVLKRLSDALADGDPILAVLRGTAINQDGRSQGLTAPNGPSQEKVLRAALADAGMEPGEVDYVEAHGTGTSLGDPIEIQALDAVYGQARGNREPLVVGSVKTNVGHMEAAAGIGGLMKVILSLRHGQIPPHLHLRTLNPALRLDPRRLRIATKLTPWPSADGPRRAAVSSFAFNGTNAHVIVEQAPPRISQTPEPRPAFLFNLSARSETSLRQLAERTAEQLRAPEISSLGDLCHTSQLGRSVFQHRASLLVREPEELAESLEAFAEGRESPRVVRGQAVAQPPGIALLFTGQGSQYPGMGQQLYDVEPRFRATLDHCAEVLAGLDAEAGVEPVPLLSLLWGEHQHLLDRTEHTQPALFALELALAELWQSWGVVPEAVIGHSVGEWVAACVAGVFSRDEGLALIAGRGRAMASVETPGAMAAVLESVQAIEERLQPLGDRVVVAAINGPNQVVISGEPEAVAEVCAACEADKVRTTVLDVSHAFHSPQMQAARDSLASVAAGIRFQPPRLPVISNLSGTVAGDEIATADYWLEHLVRPVRFAQGMEALATLGPEIFLEIGPKPVLLGMARRCLPEYPGTWLPSLRPRDSDWQRLLTSLAELQVRGVELDWKAIDGKTGHHRVALPTYPFQRKRYWYPSRSTSGGGGLETESLRSLESSVPAAAAPRDSAGSHPLLGHRLGLPGLDEVRFEGWIGVDSPSFLNDHRVHGRPLVPAAFYLTMMLAAQGEIATEEGTEAPLSGLDDIAFLAPLVVDEGTSRRVQLVMSASGEMRLLALRPGAEIYRSEAWTLQATAVMTSGAATPLLGSVGPHVLETDRPPIVDADQLYRGMEAIGFHFGPSLRWIRRLWSLDTGLSEGRAEGEGVLAELEPPEGGVRGYGSPVDPRLLDAALQTLGAACQRSVGGHGDDGLFLPFRMGSLRLDRPRTSGERFYARLRLSPETSAHDITRVRGDLALLDAQGRPWLEMRDTEFRRVEGKALAALFADTSSDAVSGAVSEATQPGEVTAGELVHRLRHLAIEERSSNLEHHLRSELARVLRLDGPDDVDPRAQLFELGLDSLMAVELKNRLETQLDTSLQATLLFDHPTPEALAVFLVDHLALAEADSTVTPEAVGAGPVDAVPVDAVPVESAADPVAASPTTQPPELATPVAPLSEAEVADLSRDQLRELLIAELDAP